MSLSEGERRERAEAAARILKDAFFQEAFAKIKQDAMEAMAKADLTQPGALEMMRVLQADVRAVQRLESALQQIVTSDKVASRQPPKVA